MDGIIATIGIVGCLVLTGWLILHSVRKIYRKQERSIG